MQAGHVLAAALLVAVAQRHVDCAADLLVEEDVLDTALNAGIVAKCELADEARFYLGQGMLEEARGAIEKLAAADPSHPELQSFRDQLEPTAKIEALTEPAAPAEFSFEVTPPAAAEMAVTEAAPAEYSMEIAPPAPEPPAPPVQMAPPPAAAPAAKADLLGEFVSGLEEALPSDFQAPPVAKAVAAAATPSAPIARPPAAPVVAPPPAEPAATGGAADMLADIFDEFKEEAEAGAQATAEDPDTHYNLGVAFREMGLLDEAIGELQKVSHAIDAGVPFRDTMQTYTWLAQCFVDKGVPEAAVQWYEKALSVAADSDTQMAVHYDMASALEAAGNKPGALSHFMQVYGANIDYRDVAERIKALRS